MPSIFYRKHRMKLFPFVLCIAFILMPAYNAVAQPPPGGEETTAEDLETAERIRVLESQRIRQDERASLWGGTGLVFTRTAILLPRKHFSLSGYFNYSHYEYVQGWRDAYKLDDPRENDMDLNIVANYGLNHWVELGAFMNIFLEDEDSDADQLHMRSRGIGWSGINGKFRIMDLDKDGLGITTTFFMRLPSPQQDSDITSDEIGYGGEINVSLKLVVISEWLEKFRVHTNWGWAYLDYFDTGLAGLYQFSKEYDLYGNYARRNDKYKDYDFDELFDENWKEDDLEMEKTYFGADHYLGSVALEYRPLQGLSTGLELVGYRMIRYNDDNLMLAPFATYTFRQIPFVKKIRKDLVTASIAGNFGMRDLNRSAPQWGVVLGLTWHTDLLF